MRPKKNNTDPNAKENAESYIEEKHTNEKPNGRFFAKNRKLPAMIGIIMLVLAVAAVAIFVWPGIGNKTPASLTAGKDITSSPSESPTPADAPNLLPVKLRDTTLSMGHELKKPFELVPEDSDETGTATDSGYRILLDKYDYTVEELSNKITITPKTGFTIKQNKNKDYMLTPLSMRPNQVYSINFSDDGEGISYSWAFQTRKEFFTTGTLPRDKATYVPINSGIEITFSHKVENDLSKYFEINPKVNGRFEIHKNTVSFVPLSPMEQDTIYTVTVKKGFTYKNEGLALQEDTTFAFQTEPKPKDENDGYSCESFEFARNIYNLYPYEVPLISVYTNLGMADEVEFSLYRYDNEEDFKQDIAAKDDRPYWCVHYNQPINYEGKEKVLSMNATFLHDSEDDDDWGYYRTKYLEIPQTLPEGHYIAVIKKDKMERRAYIQINGMAVYVGSADNKTMALVYDSESAQPVEGAQIIFDNHTMQTGKDGLAASDFQLFDEEGSRVKNYKIQREGHPGYYASIGGSYYSSDYYYDYDYYYGYGDNFSLGDIKDKYWGYLFTDRDMYMPSDTINIWGMLADKDGNTAPNKVSIVLAKGYSWYYSPNEYSVIDEKEALLTGTNTFESSISFENISQGYYDLSVVSDGQVMLSKNIYINKYIKPIYTIQSSLDKKNVVLGERVQFDMETKFFEGTPVNGMNFDYYIDGIAGQQNTGTLKTDENGKASLAFEATLNTDSWYPRSIYMNVSNSDPEESALNAYERVTVFPRDTMIKMECDTDANNQCTATITANKINIDGIRNKEWYLEEEYTGGSANVQVEAALHEVWYTKTQTGTYYNFITKLTHPTYSYERHERQLNTFQVNTVNGKGTFSFKKEEDKGYYAVLRCVDGNGRPITQQQGLYDIYRYDDYYSWRRVHNYYLKADKDDYSVNEAATLQLCREDDPVQKADNTKVLFMLFRKGLMDFSLANEMAYTFNFRENYIPNAGVMAVYFDGKNMRSTSVQTILYKKTDRALDIQVTPSQQQYRPGDTATFDVNVTDPSGKGRKAEILFSIVDEAYFALWEQSIDMLNSVYNQRVSTGYNAGSIPHTNTLEDYDYYGGAECGEGGDEGGGEVRSDFKDTAWFESVMTDETGHGQISVELPDNLTKWRVTFLGITDDLYAGDDTVNIDVRLPYFINTVFNDVFIVGDKPVLQIRSFGTEAKDGEKVDYMVQIEKDGQAWNSYSTSSVIGQRAYVELAPLEAGDYTYTVTGKYGTYQDAIQLPFEVLPGFVEQSRTDYQPLTQNIRFPDTKWPVKVYFFNENVRSYWNELLDLSYSWNNRIDSIVVRKQARILLKEFFKDEWVRDLEEYDTGKYQLSNGGIALLPYDSANPVLTAKICSLNDSSFDYDAMKEFFYRTLASENSTSTDIAASYWGLACLQEPVLLDLNALVQSPELKLIDKLYVALSYAYIGDLNSADQLYQEIINNYMTQDSLRAFLSMDDEDYDSDDIQEATSLCALLAQKINAAESGKFFEYVSNMYSTDILTSAMRLTCIKSNLKSLNMESSFTYELDGKKETVTVKGRETHSMFLTAEKLSTIQFSNIKGTVITAMVYTAPVGEISETDDRITIERTYYNRDGKPVTSFDPSEYVKVSLKISFSPTAPTGRYMIEDYLPASLCYVYSHRQANQWVDNTDVWYPHETFGQRVSFCLYHSNKDLRVRTIEYFTRVNNIGTFTADNAAVYNLESNVINYAPRVEITVE